MPAAPRPATATARQLCVTILTHLTWGMAPPLARYLQTRADPGMETMWMLCTITALSFLANIFAGCLGVSDGCVVCAGGACCGRDDAGEDDKSATAPGPATTGDASDTEEEELATVLINREWGGAAAAGACVSYDTRSSSSSSPHPSPPPHARGRTTSLSSSCVAVVCGGAPEGTTTAVDASAVAGARLLQDPHTAAAPGTPVAATTACEVGGPPAAAAVPGGDAEDLCGGKRQAPPVVWPYGVAFGFIALGREVTNLGSAAFTYAYIIQCIALMNPFITAGINRFCLKVAGTPPWFAACFLLCLGSSAVLIVGEMRAVEGVAAPTVNATAAATADEEGGFAAVFAALFGGAEAGAGGARAVGRNHVAGIVLQCISVFMSALMRIFMKLTEAKGIGGAQLANYMYLVMLPSLLFGSLVICPARGADVLATIRDDGIALACLLAFAFVYWWGGRSQIEGARRLGPVLYSSLQPTRLLSTLLATYVLLGEPVQSAAGWSGLAGLVITLVAYFRRQLR